eukprot:CAMPEP_0175134220 /NCGR_PEP_ID=MMETSP0087-20121206/8066_1 /TAXON_ID=136419 /ORGANISM="Unknown Unknown, Strain D1" /LENGTH=409 /DNA_ID=CAMNT_0016416775 /DNA_START=21 /DNA_END=1250 /DNA_ORIENTATION=-
MPKSTGKKVRMRVDDAQTPVAVSSKKRDTAPHSSKSQKKGRLEKSSKKKEEEKSKTDDTKRNISIEVEDAKTPAVGSNKKRDVTPHPSKNSKAEKSTRKKERSKSSKKKGDSIKRNISFEELDESASAEAMVQAALRDKQKYPAPPFSCKSIFNKGVLKVLVTLHRIPPQFIRYEVTATHFYLDTLRDTKKLRLVHAFPSGITVKHKPEPEAQWEYGMLKVDLPVDSWGELKEKAAKVTEKIQAKQKDRQQKLQTETIGDEANSDNGKTSKTTKKAKRGQKRKAAAAVEAEGQSHPQAPDNAEPKKKGTKKKFLEQADVFKLIEDIADENDVKVKAQLDREHQKEAKALELAQRKKKRQNLKEKGKQHIAQQAAEYRSQKQREKKARKKAASEQDQDSGDQKKRRVSFA